MKGSPSRKLLIVSRQAYEARIQDGRVQQQPVHVHMMISIPPKYAVSQVIGYIKGKSVIHLARVSLA